MGSPVSGGVAPGYFINPLRGFSEYPYPRVQQKMWDMLSLGERGPPPAFSSAGAGRVRGRWACARPFAVHTAPLKALGNDHATSSTFSRNLGTALRCLWFQGIDSLTFRFLSQRGENVETRVGRHRPPLQVNAQTLMSLCIEAGEAILSCAILLP